MFELRACPTCRDWSRSRNNEKCSTCGDVDHPGFVVVVSSGYWPLVSMSPEHYAKLRPLDGGGVSERICQRCGRENPIWWIDDDLWNAAIGTPKNPRGEGIIICPSCFVREVIVMTRAEAE